MIAEVSLTNAPWSPHLTEQAQSCFSYHPAWHALIARLYGYQVKSLTATGTAGQITGFLPLCALSSPLTGKRLVSLPFSDQCPLLAEDEHSANDLIDAAIHMAQEQKARYLELRPGMGSVLDQRDDFVRGDLYVRWLLSLEPEPAQVWSKLRKPVQHQIKKARKMGVQARITASREEVEHYYRLHLLTRSKKQGMPTQPRSFFYGLWDAFAANEAMQVLLAEHEGKVIAGMVLLAAGDTIRYAYGASDERYLQLAPNNLLMWTAIEWACTHGYRVLDLGRTARDNEGLMEYKRRWGAEMEALPYYYYPRIDGLASTPEQSRKFQLLTACWRKLPLQISGPLGGMLYKHLG
jgi:FemAB-related protein (PEP-CTERM system-associated)